MLDREHHKCCQCMGLQGRWRHANSRVGGVPGRGIMTLSRVSNTHCLASSLRNPVEIKECVRVPSVFVNQHTIKIAQQIRDVRATVRNSSIAFLSVGNELKSTPRCLIYSSVIGILFGSSAIAFSNSRDGFSSLAEQFIAVRDGRSERGSDVMALVLFFRSRPIRGVSSLDSVGDECSEKDNNLV